MRLKAILHNPYNRRWEIHAGKIAFSRVVGSLIAPLLNTHTQTLHTQVHIFE